MPELRNLSNILTLQSSRWGVQPKIHATSDNEDDLKSPNSDSDPKIDTKPHAEDSQQESGDGKLQSKDTDKESTDQQHMISEQDWNEMQQVPWNDMERVGVALEHPQEQEETHKGNEDQNSRPLIEQTSPAQDIELPTEEEGLQTQEEIEPNNSTSEFSNAVEHSSPPPKAGGDKLGAEALLDLGKQNNNKTEEKTEYEEQERQQEQEDSVTSHSHYTDPQDAVAVAVAVAAVANASNQEESASKPKAKGRQKRSNSDEFNSISKDDENVNKRTANGSSNKRQKRSDSTSLTSAASELDENHTSNSNMETDLHLQELFTGTENPNWQRFYAESINDDDKSAPVDLNMLINSTAPRKPSSRRGRKPKSTNNNQRLSPQPVPISSNSNVDPALEQLDISSAAADPDGSNVNDSAVLSREMSQLEDAMMHASAIARSLASSGHSNHNPVYDDSLKADNQHASGAKPLSVDGKDPNVDGEIPLEDIKLSHDIATESEMKYWQQQENSGNLPVIANKKRKRRNSSQSINGSLPDRESGSHSEEDSVHNSKMDNGSDILMMLDDLPQNLPSGSGGNFVPEEVCRIDQFMQKYCEVHHLTREELCQRVWSNNRKKDRFWDFAAEVLPHRTRASIYKHIRRAYHVFKARGKWTPEEDQTLRALYEEKGPQWKVIGLTMYRMPEDCRDRWRNYVKCGEKRVSNKWSTEEELQLTQIVTDLRNEFPDQEINWTLVSERMGGIRSRIQCRYKWNKLTLRCIISKVDAMMHTDRLSLLKYIRDNGYEEESQVDWDGFAAMDSRGFWSGKELKIAFDRIKPKYTNKPFRNIVEDLCNQYAAFEQHQPNENNQFDTDTAAKAVVVSSEAAAAAVAASAAAAVGASELVAESRSLGTSVSSEFTPSLAEANSNISNTSANPTTTATTATVESNGNTELEKNGEDNNDESCIEPIIKNVSMNFGEDSSSNHLQKLKEEAQPEI